MNTMPYDSRNASFERALYACHHISPHGQTTIGRHIAMRRRGAVLPILAVMLIVLFVCAALGVDIARMHLTRAELTTATDAACRAGTEALGRTQDPQAAITAAVVVAKQNEVAGIPLTLDPADVIVGRVTTNGAGEFVFDPNPPVGQFNAVRVTGDRSATSLDGPVGMLFGPLFGVTHFEPVLSAAANRLDRDICLVLDTSTSMGQNNRIQSLTKALDSFLNECEATITEERVSLVVYNSTATKLVPLTTDYNQIRTTFAAQTLQSSTAIGEGINAGLSSVLYDPLARPYANKSLLVMTDGNHNTGLDPVTAAQSCAANNIVVNTVTLEDGANQTLMQQTAETGNGIFLHAKDEKQLSKHFRTIARQIPVILVE